LEEFVNLSEREKDILRCIVQQFILTAAPVGSRNISKKPEIGLSAASIRNIMSDLEELGLINHPHTSAGRVPTDKGYRFYVDSLMEVQTLADSEKERIEREFNSYINETDELLIVASRLLSNITNNIACVLYPNLDSGILSKIHLVQLTGQRILVVISLDSSLVRTITLEVKMEIKESYLSRVQTLMNERLGGLTFAEIRKTFRERFSDIPESDKPLITYFIDSADKIFADNKPYDKIHITGTKNILSQPEFENPDKFQGIIELIENKDIVIHIFEKSNASFGDNRILVSIGSENEDLKLSDYSLVKKEYKANSINGTLGIIGPKRMEYAKVMAIVDYISNVLTSYLKKEN